MVATVAAAFSQFSSRLEITELQHSVVAARQQAVRDAVARHDEVIDSFLTGSYVRHTMIAPLKEADIDVCIVLASSLFTRFTGDNPQGALLDHIRFGLRQTYPRTPDISRNGQAVSIRFSDFLVDVVPAFKRQGGGFLIPSSVSRSWISTDPKIHVDLMSRSNEEHGGGMVPLVKMLKAWNRTAGSFFRSFHLEVLLLEVMKSVTISDSPSGARYFFDKARQLVAQKNPDPAGYSDDVGAYIDSAARIAEAQSKFTTAYDRAVRAEAASLAGRPWDAIAIWKQIFGDFFPEYG